MGSDGNQCECFRILVEMSRLHNGGHCAIGEGQVYCSSDMIGSTETIHVCNCTGVQGIIHDLLPVKLATVKYLHHGYCTIRESGLLLVCL